MKYIKEFKLFENNVHLKVQLIDQLDVDDIDKLYDIIFKYNTIEEVFDLSTDFVLKYIDDNEFINDIIDEEINNSIIDDFGEYDYKDWLNENQYADIEDEILETYIRNNEDEIDSQIEFSNDMINQLDEDDLKKIIINLNYTDDFISDMIHNRYYNCSVSDYLYENYGSYLNFNIIYPIIRDYIDESIIIDDFNDSIGDYERRNMIYDNVEYYAEIQKYLVNIDNNNIIYLSEILIGKVFTIFEEYEYQKIYIEKYADKNLNDENAKAKAIKFLNDNFKLDSDIEDEYADDIWMINADNFNL